MEDVEVIPQSWIPNEISVGVLNGYVPYSWKKNNTIIDRSENMIVVQVWCFVFFVCLCTLKPVLWKMLETTEFCLMSLKYCFSFFRGIFSS